MSDVLATELERFARALIDAQQGLLDVMHRRRVALTASDLPALEALRTPETEATQRLQTLITWRTKLLDIARRAGMNYPTLTDLAKSLRSSKQPAVLSLLQSAHKLALELQQESWVQWVITNRCCHVYQEVLDLIAQGGKKSPTYQSQDWLQRGGVMLNASA